MPKPELKARLRLGTKVFVALIAIDVIKYFAGTTMRSGSWPIMGILAAIAASAIVVYFMHIRQLWRPEE